MSAVGSALDARDGAEERARVGMLRAFHDVEGRADFDDFALIHHRDAVGDVFHDGQVVGDKDEREVETADEIGEEIQDLRLDGDVEGGDGFVGDDDLGI